MTRKSARRICIICKHSITHISQKNNQTALRVLSRSRLSFSSLFRSNGESWSADNTETDVAVRVRQGTPFAVRRPAGPGIGPPAVASMYTVVARGGANWISLSTRTICIIPIVTPFTHIPAYVIQSKRIRRITSNIGRMANIIVVIRF